MTPQEQQSVINDPTKRWLLAYEPTLGELEKIFTEIPCTQVITTPTKHYFRGETFQLLKTLRLKK